MKILILIIIIVIIIVCYFIFFRQLYNSDDILKGNENINADKLMIVAHPDDELIFGGSELISEPGWKVVCVTNGSKRSGNILSLCPAEKRINEFVAVMNCLKCQYEMLDYEDNGFNSNWNKKSLTNKLKQLINEKPYKKIITHNLEGEYGHIQHKKISNIIHDLKPQNLYIFGFKPEYINPYRDELVKLLNIYHTQKNVIEKHKKYINNQLCTKVVF